MTLHTMLLSAGLAVITCTALSPAGLAPDPAPTPPALARPRLVAAARPAPEFRFSAHDQLGRPVRWPSCHPIDLVVNPTGAPAGAWDNLKRAVRVLNAASHLHLTLTGRTIARPESQGWPTRLPAGPTGWPPVLIAWAPPGTPGLDDDGSSATTTTISVDTPTGLTVLVAGEVVLNQRQNPLYAGGSTGLGTALFEHELSHLLGLDHTDRTDRVDVMNPVIGAARGLGPGDRQGLTVAGHGGCPPVPHP